MDASPYLQWHDWADGTILARCRASARRGEKASWLASARYVRNARAAWRGSPWRRTRAAVQAVEPCANNTNSHRSRKRISGRFVATNKMPKRHTRREDHARGSTGIVGQAMSRAQGEVPHDGTEHHRNSQPHSRPRAAVQGGPRGRWTATNWARPEAGPRGEMLRADHPGTVARPAPAGPQISKIIASPAEDHPGRL